MNLRLSDVLLPIFACLLLTWYVRYHLRRLRLYKMARKRPGPIALPLIGSAWYFLGSTADILKSVMKLTETFSPPVSLWLGHRLIFAIWKPQDLQTIMNSSGALEKDELYRFLEPGVGHGLITAPVAIWKRHRRIIIPTFNNKVPSGFVEVFSREAEVLAEQFKEVAGKGNFDLLHYDSRYTMNIICETAMGVTSHTSYVISNKFSAWMNRAMEIMYERIFKIWYHPDLLFNLSPLSGELTELVTTCRDFSRNIIKEKREAYYTNLETKGMHQEGSSSFLQQLIELSEAGDGFTEEEMLDEVNTFVVAGSHTTATMSSFIFIILGMYPDVQQKVFEEIIDVLGPDRPVAHEDLGKLQYLDRVVHESMRVFPVLPMALRRITKDVKLETCTIPAGSSVVMIILALHRDPEVWPDPLKFDPDRFLEEEVAKRHAYSWLPFSGGTRNCAGAAYALMSMKTFIATVVRRYRIFTDYKKIEDVQMKVNIVLQPVDGCKVSIELRE